MGGVLFTNIYNIYKIILRGYIDELSGLIYLPIDNRTFAGFLSDDSYAFHAEGGYSWGIPYLAGVMALGFQVNPNLTVEEIWKKIYATGTPLHKSVLINPEAFIESVK